ncbi:MAG TPA: hypothetical protein VEB68_09820 [Croceibacterium sp.]|nr:hypothetical protein [Croceibacterium sp.]
MLANIDDSLIWLGGVASGLAVIWAGWRLLRSIPLASDVLLGKWYGYSYFYDTDRVRFYKEVIEIRRSRLRPWQMIHQTAPCGGDEPAGYYGPVYYHAPYVHTVALERASGDRTFDIGRLVMGADHKYKMIVSLHIGNSYEETVHSASAYLWVREQLDPAANEKLAPNSKEEEEFRERVSRFVKIDREHLQIQLTPPRRTASRASTN